MSSSARLKDAVLDLLINGPSSFAGIYGAVRRHTGHAANAPPIPWLLGSLMVLSEVGLVRVTLMTGSGFVAPNPSDIEQARSAYEAWLPTASFDDLAADEVGLWFELTAVGRAEWQRSNPSVVDPWLLDEDAGDGTVSVYAETEQLASERLHWWTGQHPGASVEDVQLEPVAGFVLRNGVHVSGGVKLTCRYRARSSDPGSS